MEETNHREISTSSQIIILNITKNDKVIYQNSYYPELNKTAIEDDINKFNL